MRRNALLIITLIAVTSSVSSQGVIKGKVFDSETKQPLYTATVSVAIGGTIIGKSTDFDGKYTIKPLAPGVYDLSVKYLGKQEYVLEDIRVTNNKITWIKDVYLATRSDTLNIYEVKAERYEDNERLIKPEDPSAITLLPAQFKDNPQLKTPKTMIANMVPGIYQEDEGQPLYFRGSREEAVKYIVDGVHTREGRLSIPSTAIGEITVYTGGVPAKYGDLTGGVVVIETKSYFDLYNQRNKRY